MTEIELDGENLMEKLSIIEWFSHEMLNIVQQILITSIVGSTPKQHKGGLVLCARKYQGVIVYAEHI